jgi:hypothetical protein
MASLRMCLPKEPSGDIGLALVNALIAQSGSASRQAGARQRHDRRLLRAFCSGAIGW